MLFVWRWLLFLKGFGVVCPLTWVPNKIICFIQLYCSCRKGIPCHEQIVDGLLQNMPIGAGDRVLFLDLLPNRFLACVVKKSVVHTFVVFGSKPAECVDMDPITAL